MVTVNSPLKVLFKIYVQLKRFCINAFNIKQDTANFVMRNCLAALIAMGIAWSLGSHEYYWAAVTSWVMAINGRGRIISKSLYRASGTAIGAIFAFAIMPLSTIPWLYIVVLALWGAVCASTACLLRRFRAYTAQLAGYTATIIGGFVLVTPTELHFGFAIDRFVSVLIGIASAALVALTLIPKTNRKVLGDETRQWAKKTMNWAANIIDQTIASKEVAPSLDLWRGISEFEYTCTCAAIESTKINRYLPTIRSVLASQLALVAMVRAFCRFSKPEYHSYFIQLKALLGTVALKIEERVSFEDEIQQIRQIAYELNHVHQHTTLTDQTLSVKLESIALNLTSIQQDFFMLQNGQSWTEDNTPSLNLHYDWGRSVSTGIRIFIPTLLVGIVWLHVGGQGWSLAFVMTSIASNLFGTFPGATKALKGFLISISTASIIYLIWSVIAHWFNLGELASFFVVLIFTTLAAWVLSNGYVRAMDFNTYFPMLMLGMTADRYSLSTQFSAGLGLMLGVIVTFIALWLPVRHEDDKVKSMDEQIDILFNRLVDQQWMPHRRIWEECIYDLMAQASLLSLSRQKLIYLLGRYQRALDNGNEVIWLRSGDIRHVLPKDVYDHIDDALNQLLALKRHDHVKHELLKTAVYLLRKEQKEQQQHVKECMHQAAASLVSLSHGLHV